ncbi:MAG TPA: SiaB family protein kinase [Flavobacteriales bacterium]|nr:SiaB family protein kinase [Flavobacteriales bacterium]
MKTLHDHLKNDKICLSYLGSFDDAITDKLIGISEFYLANRSELGKLKNKVSFLIAECFQNIVRHGETRRSNGSDFFQVNILDDRTVLASCNRVAEQFVPDIEKKLIQVNSLDADGLKRLYKEIMSNESFSDKGGAGLGLIEMARKSGLPLKYTFKDIGDGFKRFFLALEIVSKEGSGEKIKMSDIESFYTMLANEKILMLYKGDLSRDIIIPLVEMVQNNFPDTGSVSGKEKRSVITLIESLQNVSKHGKSVNGVREGIFTFMRSGESYRINVGNPIDEHEYTGLDNALNSLKGMNADELQDLYKKRLLEPDITPHGNCGLGLIEIARNSAGSFQHSFTKSTENEIFYTINITI